MNAVLQWAGWLATATLSTAVYADAKTPLALDPAQCQPLDADLSLPTVWEPYRGAVRACPLVQGGAAGNAPAKAAKVRLLAVFTDAHYRGLPPDAPWGRFPLPLLVDDTGRCVGKLTHLFPADPPEELEVVPSRWHDGVPHEIQLQVRSPAVGGDYHLPTLRWDARNRLYRTVSGLASVKPETPPPDPCP
ncbi:hypothetical protein LL962_04875 [Xanthomonas sp. NCPPB 1067]|uniref:hypothetical protein n=1 Tax=Xanthomonas sp. NCPPB 1067 TaxID=487524 RepID=UPI001E3FB2CA|nr:hypothetical protein [Xanthomonas sp. NCPPB 1067]MCC4586446.1 hypothetical protein [Xanthomonas sp. NCPPB 1067]